MVKCILWLQHHNNPVALFPPCWTPYDDYSHMSKQNPFKRIQSTIPRACSSKAPPGFDPSFCNLSISQHHPYRNLALTSAPSACVFCRCSSCPSVLPCTFCDWPSALPPTVPLEMGSRPWAEDWSSRSGDWRPGLVEDMLDVWYATGGQKGWLWCE